MTLPDTAPRIHPPDPEPRDGDGSTCETLVRIIRDTLALSESELVATDQLLFYDLGFTSMDLVDFLFRIEDELQVQISEETISTLARESMDESEFARDGTLTPAGRECLMQLLSDTPRDCFPEVIELQTLPRYCTVAAVARIVDRMRPRS